MSDHGLFSDPPEVAPPERPAGPRNGRGTAALVLGIVAAVTGLAGLFVLPLVIAVPAGVLGVFLGVTGRRRTHHGPAASRATNGAQATAGLVLSVVGLVAALVWTAVIGVGVRDVLERCDPDLPDAVVQQCIDVLT